MRPPIFPRFSVLFAAALLMLACQNCGSDTKGKPENTLRIRIEQDATSMHPLLATSGYARYVSGQIFQMLASLEPKTLALQPQLLKSIPTLRQVADGPHKGEIAYDFEVLDEAKWDNGSPVTGRDVLFTAKFIMHPLISDGVVGPSKAYFEQVRDIEVDAANPKKFTVYFSEYYILGLETICQLMILPAYNYDPSSKMADVALADLLDAKKAAALAASNPNLKSFAEEAAQEKFAIDKNFVSGSGPYQLEHMKSGDGVVLARKQNWWGDALAAARPQLEAFPDKLVYRPVTDDALVETMLRNGELDLVLNLNAAKFLDLKADQSLAARYDFATNSPSSYSYVMLHNRNPKLADKRVREALAHIFDYDYLVNTVGRGMTRRVVGPINPIKPYYASDIAPHDFNLEKARQLLADAGWKDTDGNGLVDKVVGGKRTDLSINLLATTTSESTRLSAENWKENAQKVGISVEIVPTVLKKITELTRAGDYEAALLAASVFPLADDMFPYLHSRSFAPDNGDNRTRFANVEADKVMEAIRVETDLTKRYEQCKQLQQIIHEELPCIYLTSPDQRYVVANRFEAVLSVNRPGFYESRFKLK